VSFAVPLINGEGMMIPFIDLKAQYERLEKEINSRIQTVLQHGRFVMGPEIDEIERKLSQFVGVKHTITCSSGTDALLMPLMAWNVGHGDAVFTTPFTFIATAEVIQLLGATPVFVDIEENTFNINPVKLRSEIEKTVAMGKLRPKAVIPVDLFGLPADYDEINALAEEFNLVVLEDAAQSFGATYNGKKSCSLAHAAATSFFPAKPLGCYGDGGAIFTNDDKLAEILRSIRVHGQGTNKYENIRIGLNARFDTLQAAILLPKLEIFPGEVEMRQKVAEKYSRALENRVRTPYVPRDRSSVWAQYSILARDSEERAAMQEKLKKNGVPSAIYYPVPLHLQQAFSSLGYKQGDFPVAEEISKKIFSLPMHPYLEDEQINKIIDILID